MRNIAFIIGGCLLFRVDFTRGALENTLAQNWHEKFSWSETLALLQNNTTTWLTSNKPLREHFAALPSEIYNDSGKSPHATRANRLTLRA